MGEIMRGEATPAQIGSFLTALRMKGETVPEIVGCARAMRASAIPVRTSRQVVDTCGTGGDGANTFNISTVTAFVVAGAGLAVAKHGNYSVSSRCGSADLMQALGVNIQLNAEQIGRCIDQVGIGFLFAPALHPAMKHAIGPRREIGLRTIFNILGPISNPASAPRQLLGVYSPDLVEPLALVLLSLGSQFAIVVHGADGLDELSTTGANRMCLARNGRVENLTLDAVELGLARVRLADLAGGTPQENAVIARDVLRSQAGPRCDVVLLNAAAALMAGGVTPDMKQGLKLAAEAIDSGQALKKIEQLVEASHSFG